MKIILIAIFFNILFINSIKAQDIKEYEIDGISIGDSALDHFTKKDLKDSLDIFYYKNRKYVYYFRESRKSERYDYIHDYLISPTGRMSLW